MSPRKAIIECGNTASLALAAVHLMGKPTLDIKDAVMASDTRKSGAVPSSESLGHRVTHDDPDHGAVQRGGLGKVPGLSSHDEEISMYSGITNTDPAELRLLAQSLRLHANTLEKEATRIDMEDRLDAAGIKTLLTPIECEILLTLHDPEYRTITIAGAAHNAALERLKGIGMVREAKGYNALTDEGLSTALALEAAG